MSFRGSPWLVTPMRRSVGARDEILLFPLVFLHDALHVLDGLGIGRNALVLLDRCGAGIICGNCLEDLVRVLLILQQQLAQIARAGLSVFAGIIRIGV